jgi:uncharacterized protein (DUF433 family)
MENFKKYIVIDSSKRFGQPVIKGTRISVSDVLSWLAHGMRHEDIIYEYPELSEVQINACLWYAAHKENRTRVA